MGERSRNSTNRARRSTTAPASGTGGGATSWADRLLLEPVLDDGRRSNTTKAPPASPVSGDRYIVGYNASGAWASLRGELVTYNGSAWVASSSLYTASIVYSKKREEYLELTDLVGATILPALTPELLQTVTPAPGNIKFWLPLHLVDTLGNVLDQGSVRSRTVESASFTSEEYYRYIVKVGDATIPALAGYVATLVTDSVTHTSYWVFHKPAEGSLVYVDDTNAYYYYNGTTWVLFTSGGTGGPVGTLFAAEGRPGTGATSKHTLQAAVINTYQKIPFAHSAITDLDVCPPAFFSDGDDIFTIPRDGFYVVGFSGFYITYADPLFPIEELFLAIKVNGAVVAQIAEIPAVDQFEGQSVYHLFKLELGDEVTFEFRTTGANWDSEFTINNGMSAVVYTADGGGAFVPHALDDHTDTNLGTPADGDVVQWDSGTSRYITGPVVATASPHLIIGTSHSDSLLIGSITNGQFLKRIAGSWSNWTPVLSDLDDILLSSPSTGQVLMYDGSNFVNTALAGAFAYDGLSDVNMTGKVNGSIGRWSAGTNRYVPWTPVLSGLADVNTTGAVAGNSLVFNGSIWAPGTVTAVVSAVYFVGSVVYGAFANPSWTLYSGSGGSFSQTQVGGSFGYWFFLPPVTGNYEMIVTGSAVINPTGTIKWGIYLNNTGAVLGQETRITYPGASTVVSAVGVAYLTAGGSNRIGFAFVDGTGARGDANLNISLKLIGQ